MTELESLMNDILRLKDRYVSLITEYEHKLFLLEEKERKLEAKEQSLNEQAVIDIFGSPSLFDR